MERWANEDGVQGLFEIFTVSQHLILNSLDFHQMRLTRYQMFLMMVLARNCLLYTSDAADD